MTFSMIEHTESQCRRVDNIEKHFINRAATYWPEKPISSVAYLAVIQLWRRSLIHCYANIRRHTILQLLPFSALQP